MVGPRTFTSATALVVPFPTSAPERSSAASRRVTRASAASSSFSRIKVLRSPPASVSTAAPPSLGRSSSLRAERARFGDGGGIGRNGKGDGRACQARAGAPSSLRSAEPSMRDFVTLYARRRIWAAEKR
jgi:hypothetical protein